MWKYYADVISRETVHDNVYTPFRSYQSVLHSSPFIIENKNNQGEDQTP
eukprot:UN22106